MEATRSFFPGASAPHRDKNISTFQNAASAPQVMWRNFLLVTESAADGCLATTNASGAQPPERIGKKEKAARLAFPFKLSRDITEITPLWETPSLQPFLKTYWLTPVNDWPIVAKHANMTSSRGSINAAPATIRQNLFLHLAEPRLWLKMLQLTVKVRSFEGRPHGCSSAAFRWVWHFLKVVRLPSDQRWTFGTQVMSSCRLKVRIPLTVEPAGQDISPASHAPLPWRCGEPRADAGAKGSHVAADAARKNPLCKHAAPASERRSAVCKAQSLLSHSHDNTFTW